MEELIEKYAIRISQGNDAAKWPYYVSEAKKVFFRDIVRDLIDDINHHRDVTDVARNMQAARTGWDVLDAMNKAQTTKPSGV
jgi:hypothetical protein